MALNGSHEHLSDPDGAFSRDVIRKIVGPMNHTFGRVEGEVAAERSNGAYRRPSDFIFSQPAAHIGDKAALGESFDFLGDQDDSRFPFGAILLCGLCAFIVLMIIIL